MGFTGHPKPLWPLPGGLVGEGRCRSTKRHGRRGVPGGGKPPVGGRVLVLVGGDLLRGGHGILLPGGICGRPEREVRREGSHNNDRENEKGILVTRAMIGEKEFKKKVKINHKDQYEIMPQRSCLHPSYTFPCISLCHLSVLSLCVLQGERHVDGQRSGCSRWTADGALQDVETPHHGHLRPRRYGLLLRYSTAHMLRPSVNAHLI